MKTKIPFILLILLMFNCSSDNEDSTENGTCTSDIPFLIEGNTWTYKITSFGFDAGNTNLTIGKCNGEGFLIVTELPNFSTGKMETITGLWKQDGDFILADANNDKDYFAKIYKKNVFLGEIWTHTKADGTVVTHEVIAIDSLITVPAGTFTCNVYKYSSEATINETFVCWNDDIGNVKEDTGGLFDLELVSYDLN